jgi:F0F1-type ATP synthase membrane subunit c/vacuolar-type H+-ATPase subunit K
LGLAGAAGIGVAAKRNCMNRTRFRAILLMAISAELVLILVLLVR